MYRRTSSILVVGNSDRGSCAAQNEMYLMRMIWYNMNVLYQRNITHEDIPLRTMDGLFSDEECYALQRSRDNNNTVSRVSMRLSHTNERAHTSMCVWILIKRVPVFALCVTLPIISVACTLYNVFLSIERRVVFFFVYLYVACHAPAPIHAI